MRSPKAPHKYLATHAEPEAQLASAFDEDIGDVLVIPSCGEADSLCVTVDSVPHSARGAVAIIAVLNAREDAPDWVHLANEQTRAELRKRYGKGEALAANARRHEHPRGTLLMIDRACASQYLPPQQGVGLARKLGADVALQLAVAGRLKSPWIHCSDADALLPSDYFERSLAHERAPDRDSDAALLFPFRHEGMRGSQPEAASAAALEYEASLRYYVLGLRHAGSAYAFHTIGSTIAIRALAYAQVRGFPRRNAGEDFYVLNKLRKLGGIRALEGEPIRLSDRLSERVPFGTGAALRAAAERGVARLTYPPLLFEYLRAWLAALEELAGDPGANLEDLVASKATSPLDAALLLEQLGARKLLSRAQQAAAVDSEAQRRKRLLTFFDAFETLKLLHALRDAAYPEIELRDALAQARFLSLRGNESLQKISHALIAAERAPYTGND